MKNLNSVLIQLISGHNKIQPQNILLGKTERLGAILEVEYTIKGSSSDPFIAHIDIWDVVDTKLQKEITNCITREISASKTCHAREDRNKISRQLMKELIDKASMSDLRKIFKVESHESLSPLVIQKVSFNVE